MVFSNIAGIVIPGVAAVVAAMPVLACGEGVGFREIGGVNVAAGTETLEGPLVLSPEATYLKTGMGTLEIPAAAIDNRTSYRIDVVGGGVKILGGSEKEAVPVPPPVMQDAALWLDASDLPEGDLFEWRDARGESGGWSAQSRHLSGSGLAAAANVTVVTTNGVKCVSFGGHSGKYMRFVKGASNGAIEGVHHFFAVHGVDSCWGALLGNFTSAKIGGVDTYRAELDGFVVSRKGTPVAADSAVGHFFPAGNYSASMYQSRVFLDGRRIDPYSVPPRRGFQLLEGDMMVKPSRFETLFCNRTSYSAAGDAGGDFICETILFTNRLSESQRLDVERYLMAKWNLPSGTMKPTTSARRQMPMPRGTGIIRLAEGASAEVSAASGEITAPLAFEGAGSASKTGEGMMVVGAGASLQFSGEFSLQDGSLLLRGGAMPPVTAVGGETYTAERWPTARPSADGSNDVTSGVRVVRSTGGKAGVFRKTGAGAVALKGAAADVARINVDGGMLVLCGAETNSVHAKFDDGVALINVHVPNCSFEMPFTVSGASNNGLITKSDTVSSNGWYAIGGHSVHFITANRSAGTGYSAWAAYPPPDGEQALLLRGAASAETDVTIPRAGTYELSFFANSRYGIGTASDPGSYAIYKPVMDLKFNGRTIGRTHISKDGFARFRYRFTVGADEAGTSRRLCFKAIRSDAEFGILLDDVRIRAVANAGRADAVKVPGGDFEVSDIAGGGAATGMTTPFFSRNVVSEGWTLSLLDASPGTGHVNGFVSVVNGGMAMCVTNKNGGARHIPLYPHADFLCGASVLGFVGANGKAESAEGRAVVLPPGRWRLRGKASKLQADQLEVPFGVGVYTQFLANPSLSATLIREDGSTAELGCIATASRIMEGVLWPGEILLDVTQNVRISLVQTVANAACLVDDLEFVPVTASEPDVNIFPDPGCEKASLWTTGDWSISPDTFNGRAGDIFAYDSDNARYFGCDRFDGDRALRVKGHGGMTIPVTFPARGLYRLTFHVRSRASSAIEGSLPLRGFVKLSDDEEHEIFRFAMPYVVGFQEYSFLFAMPEVGEKTFGIHGLAMGNVTSGDRTDFIDGISIVKVDDLRQSIPDLPSATKISVAEGAHLALDYAGTVKVAGLSLGGMKVAGIANAVTHPGYLTGMGEIKVEPAGLTVIAR